LIVLAVLTVRALGCAVRADFTMAAVVL